MTALPCVLRRRIPESEGSNCAAILGISGDCHSTWQDRTAAVLTENARWGFRAAWGIRAGSVHIGMHAFQSNAMAPIGGYGLSGIGRSGGKYSTEEFTELKWVSLSVEDGPE